ncbi:EpsG family protein [Photobacterium phosphoreum]|uniref:EpsG family protein n=1 Tax=Photobacterium phosphoreum TaxID=659 RepID=UPI0015E67CDA|nr:EpsG family protein [Photobacterium phosphoreum]
MNKNIAYVRIGNIYTYLLLLFVIFFAGLRVPGVDHDYNTYISWLSGDKKNFIAYVLQGKDIGFLSLYKLVTFFSNNLALFFIIIAAISVIAKYTFCKLAFDNKFVGILVLLVFSRLYLTQEFTQVRVAIAMGIASCAVLYWYNNKRKISFALMLTGLTFHLSVIIIPLFFLIYNYCSFLKRRYVLFFIPLVAYFLSPLCIEAMHLIGSSRIEVYINGSYHTTKLSVFSAYYLIRLFLFYFILFFVFNKTNEKEKIYIYFLACSLFLQVVFSWNDVFSLRFTEVLALFDLSALILPLKYLSKQFRLGYFVFIVLVSFLFFYSSLKIVLPYNNYILMMIK